MIDLVTRLYNEPVSVQLCNEAAERIKMLEKGLRFYAYNDNPPNDGPWGVQSNDFGDVARAALEGIL